ncbi:protein FAR1-RELATED SEQUENCE 1-like [Chenopodium quinoa]|uniref:protein FAR1-RELATED SEQUENCE 1-like n=1 Tax=Chenopodium quinoa TaxID=63459 RepID=UPI000B76D130|nr:protein FAR1-RELATED SEQUENCE 1-like [Chenopodium quinoa]
MVFKKWQDIEAYYKEYAEQKGFGVCRVQGVYSKGSNRDRTTTTWRCECWGGPDTRAQREAKKRAKSMHVSGGVVDGVVCEDELSRRKRRSKICGCQAMIYGSVDRDSEWTLKKVKLEHTHLTSPGKVKLVKEYRMKNFTSKVKRKLLNYFKEGVPVSQIHGCMVNESGGPENIAFTVKDLQHEVYKERRLQMVGGDSTAMMAYFAKMQVGNQNFYHSQRYKEFKTEPKATVYESFTVQEFESRWLAFVKEYALHDNDWLNGLHEERHMWVPAFMKEYFWAGMKTAQRVENISSFFDGFVNRHTKLFEFPHKYSREMTKRVQDENDADAKCSKYLRRLVTGFNVEKVFQKLYTNTKFQEDRVWIVPEGSSEEVLTNRRRFYCATFNTDTKEILCDCRKFETHSIMCKHIIRILDLNFVKEIPNKYIVNRWRKDILRKHTRVKVSYHDPSKSIEVIRYNRLMNAFEGICDEAAMVNDETVEMVLTSLTRLKSEVTKCMKRKLEQTVAMSYPGEGAATVIPSSEDRATTSSVQKPLPQADQAPDQPPSGALCDNGIVMKDPFPRREVEAKIVAANSKVQADDTPTNAIGKIHVSGLQPDDVLPSHLDYNPEDDSFPHNSSRGSSSVSATF